MPLLSKQMLLLTAVLFVLSLASSRSSCSAFTTPFGVIHSVASRREQTATTLTMSGAGEEATPPSTFREAEVLGLKLMQEQKYEDALKAFQTGMKLPGSRTDVIRTKSLAGPSPVGGSMGGYESKKTVTLDEFELQAVHYNMACAYAQLALSAECVQALSQAFDNGFDNFSTVRADPDLESVKGTAAFDALMEKYEPKTKGFNPFGLFGK